MLNVHNLTVSFMGTDLFSGITFKLNKGDRIGLIGKNGAGKSTLLKVLSKDIESSGTMAFDKDVQIGCATVPAGKYGFFVIPSHKSWTIIFNKKWDQHGKDEYNENDDVHRFEVIPNNLDVVKDHLEYEISKKSEASGIISLAWEKIEIQFEFEIKM